jgi:hypothetical protein
MHKPDLWGEGFRCKKFLIASIAPLNAYRANMHENTLLLGALI